MAKTNDLNTAIKELKKNYKQVLEEAVQYATEEAQKDVHTRALTCLDAYYANYNPTSYDPRSKSLSKSFVPYMNIKSNNTHIISTVGVEYNSDILEAYAASSYYDASKKYGNVDGAWVIDNYLDGIHPTTDGSSIPGQAVYTEIYDNDQSPTEKMDNYLTKYVNTFSANVHSYLAAYLLK